MIWLGPGVPDFRGTSVPRTEPGMFTYSFRLLRCVNGHALVTHQKANHLAGLRFCFGRDRAQQEAEDWEGHAPGAKSVDLYVGDSIRLGSMIEGSTRNPHRISGSPPLKKTCPCWFPVRCTMCFFHMTYPLCNLERGRMADGTRIAKQGGQPEKHISGNEGKICFYLGVAQTDRDRDR